MRRRGSSPQIPLKGLRFEPHAAAARSARLEALGILIRVIAETCDFVAARTCRAHTRFFAPGS